MADLVVKIAGDMQDFSDMLKAAEQDTEKFTSKLKGLGLVAGVEFAALSAAAIVCVNAFDQQEKAVGQLTRSMQLQGIYSKELIESYKAEAEAIEHKTGIQSESILKGQASLQGMIGQIPITKEMTRAAIALSKETGSVESAFDIMGKAALGNTVALHKMGIEFTDHHNRTENLAEVTKKIAEVFPQVGDGATRGLGGLKLLSVAFEDMQKKIGEKLMPAFETVINGMVRFFQSIADNEELLNLITSMGIAAGVISGVVLAVTAGALAFFKLKAAMLAAGIATEATSLAVKGLVGATGIGLLIIIASEVYLHWGSIWPRVYAGFKAFADAIANIAASLGEILYGAFNMDLNKIKNGWNQLKETLKVTLDTYNQTLDGKLKEQQDVIDKAEEKKVAKNNAAGDAREAERKRRERIEKEIEANKQQVILDQLEKFNSDYIKLEQQETQLLEASKDEQNKKIWGKLEEQLTMVRALKFAAQEQALQQQVDFDSKILEQAQEFQDLSAGQQAVFLQLNQQTLRDGLWTEQMARDQAAKDKVTKMVKTENEYLATKQKFGKLMADWQKKSNSEEMQAGEELSGNLAQLAHSRNDTLKTIGKAGAIANIGIKTQHAILTALMDSVILFGPIAGPPIGAALGIALGAYAAEQIADILAMADGGVVSGGIAGVDSVPAMLMPGEMVVPKSNFNEVIDSVVASRGGGGASASAGGGSGGGFAEIELRLKDGLMDFIETKLIQRQNLHISMQGA